VSWWALILTLPAALVAIADWRKGLFAMVVVAFLQDAARKLEVDKPVYFTLLVGVVFAFAYLRAQMRQRFLPGQIIGWKQYLRMPFVLFVLLLVAQAVNSIVRYGNPFMTGIGALSYLAPLPALLAGYHFALKAGRAGIERWLAWYLLCALLVVPSIALEYAGAEWGLLGDVGVGFHLYQEDTVLTAHSGFFRASEPAAWHTATAVCVLLLLSSLRRISNVRTVLVILAVVALLAIGVLTGRRKIFVEIAIFLSVYLSLLAVLRKGGAKLAAAAVVGGLLSYGVVLWWVTDDPAVLGQMDVRYQRYLERGATVGADISERAQGLGFAPVQWAIEGYGWLGGGLGIASQGAQHFGGGADVYGGAGEGGLGKITAELGVPGLLVAVWLGVAALWYGWQVLLFCSRRSAAVTRLACGLVALLVANFAVFFVATQVFGDLFVLLSLGLVSGFFLAAPVLAERERLQQPAVVRRPRVLPHPAVMPEVGLARGARRP
jgi:hypothetical protein